MFFIYISIYIYRDIEIYLEIEIYMDIGNAKVIFTRFQHALKGCDFFKV